MTVKEMFEAAQNILEFCAKHVDNEDTCKNCPFYDKDTYSCVFDTVPCDYWTLKLAQGYEEQSNAS